MQRLTPDPGQTTVEEQLDTYRPWEHPHEDRPFVAVNFAATVDGRASIGGVSGPIGSATDTAMLVGLRTRFDAVMIGAGTMRAERYGPVVSDPRKRERRQELGLTSNPLMMIVSARLDLPWDAGLFTEGAGSVLIFTTAETEPPETETEVAVVRHETASTSGQRCATCARRRASARCSARAVPGSTPSSRLRAWSTTSSLRSRRSWPAARRRGSSRASFPASRHWG